MTLEGYELDDSRASALAEAFLDAYPRYPVARIRIGPGQAYIAPVQNIIHDGYTRQKTCTDYNLQLSSNDVVFHDQFIKECRLRLNRS
jgi:hypothetical protein